MGTIADAPFLVKFGSKADRMCEAISRRWPRVPTWFRGAPDVPTVGEFVPGFESSPWFGVAAPKDTPVQIIIIDKLNKKINTALADPRMAARLADVGASPSVGSPADLGKHIAEETEKWGKVVKFAGVKAG
jgi:tripartite-type tricarboxylate transporter receptor subunit TctC